MQETQKPSSPVLTIESLVDIDGLLGTRLKVRNVALGLTERHGTLVGYLLHISHKPSPAIVNRVATHHSLAFIDIDLVSENHLDKSALILATTAEPTYKWKVGRVTRRRLDEKLVSPAIKRLKALCIVDIVHQHAAVRSTIERNAQRLETLLSSSVPNLMTSQYVTS